MNKKQHTLTVVLALVAGLVGGIISSQLLIDQPVYAEKKPAHEKLVRTEKLEIVDEEGKVYARLKQEGGMAFMRLQSDKNFVNFMVSRNLAMMAIVEQDSSMMNVVVDESGPSLSMFDSGQKRRIRAVLGTTELKNYRTGSTETRAPSSLVLFDEEGNVTWSAP